MWHHVVGISTLAAGAFGGFVRSPNEAVPVRATHKHSFTFRGEQIETELEMGSPSGLCDPNVKQYSGYFKFGNLNKAYFFWFFESRNDPKNDPTVMWLNGGPGCSSLTGMLYENGPCSVNEEGNDTILNPYSWNSRANVMWVDQPPGTGFSKGVYDHDEGGVAEDMYQFLQALFKAMPQYNQNFFVAGESFAGHYIPAMASRIFHGNKDLGDSAVKIELKGFAIGNGLTNVQEQYKWYPDMMCNGGGYAPPVIKNAVECAALRVAVPICEKNLAECNKQGMVNLTACASAYEVCNLAFQIPYQTTGMNPYDQRIKCAKPPLCYDMSNDVKFLNDPEVQKQLGVDKKFTSCNMIVNKLFLVDFMRNYHELIPPMLEGGLEVLIYAGDQDFICNWLGNSKWTLALDWAHKSEFNAANTTPFVVKGKAYGKMSGKEVAELRTFKNFHFLRVYQAGHMVPMDQPEAALGMLNSFIKGKMKAHPKKAEQEEVETELIV